MHLLSIIMKWPLCNRVYNYLCIDCILLHCIKKQKNFFFILKDKQNKLRRVFVMISIFLQKQPYEDVFLKYEIRVKKNQFIRKTQSDDDYDDDDDDEMNVVHVLYKRRSKNKT